MIGKQTKGTSFGGCVRYVLKEEKSKLLEAVGVDGTPERMAEQFELQALLNDKVKNIVGHTSLNFSPEDGERLKSDDALMLQIAHDYMKLMGDEETRVKRIEQLRGLSEDEAKRLVKTKDWRRKSYHNCYSRGRWGDSRNYDLSINSSRLGIEGTTKMLEEYVQARMDAMQK